MRSASRVWLTVGPVALAAGVGAVALVLGSSHEENRIVVSVFGLLIGWAFVVAGLIALTRRPENRTGVLMIVVGLAFFVGALSDSNVSILFTLGMVLGALFVGALVHLMLAYPSGRLTPGERKVVIAGYTLALLANLLPTLFDPTPGGDPCEECPENALLIWDSPLADAILSVILEGVAFLLIALVVVLLARRWRRASPAARRLLGPVLIAGGTTLGFFAITLVVYPLSTAAADLISIGFVAGFVATPFVFLWGILRSRLARSDVGVLLADSTETPTLVETQDALREALRDPTLELVYRLEDPRGHFKVDGQRVRLEEIGDDRAVTEISGEDGPIAAMIHDPALLDEPELLSSVTVALRLRLEKDRSVRALRISEYRSRALLNAIPDTMFRVARDGTVLDIHSHDPENVVIPPEQMIGTSMYDIPADVISRETMEERRVLVERAFETGDAQTQEYEINAHFGRRFAETRIVPSGENEFVMIVRDVTAERLTESRSIALLEAIPDAMFRISREGRFLDFHTPHPELLSLPSEQILGASVYDIPAHRIAPEVIRERMALAERAFATGEMQTQEYEIRSPDGDTLYSEARIVPSGEDEFVMIVRDVTHRVTQQRQIETQNEFLEAMGDATTGLLCSLHLDGRIGDDNVNLPLRELTGYAQYELDGRYFWAAFVAPADRAAAEQVIKDVVAGGNPGEQQSRWLTKDGREVIVAWTCRPMPKVTGEDPKLLVSGSDVTDRVRHEEQIQRERDYFGALFDATPSFICVVDHEGSMTSHSLNRSMIDLTGYSDEDVAGKPFAELFSAPEDAGRVQGTIAAAAGGGAPGEQETYWVTRSGRRVLVAWTCTPLPEREEARRLVISGTDVTERRLREEEQAALRRVAVAVASERRPEDIFQTVTEEVGRLLGADGASMLRYVPDANEGLILGYWRRGDPVQDDTVIGRLVTFTGGPAEIVRETGRSARYELDRTLPPGWQERLLAEGTASVVTAPVMVSGRVWGAVSATRNERAFPPDAEQRVAQFTSLVATALANAAAREELLASRARIVEAGDAERRRLERNLHDGAQQRLVSLSLALRLAQARLRTDVDAAHEILSGASAELALALEELRELARGIHPAVLTDRGLGPALESLADRTPLPVTLEQVPQERLPAPVEAAAFYVVSEALANVTKYADASEVNVRIATEDGLAIVEVSDDGVGGADPKAGSGLRGLSDRVAALEGRLAIVSTPGAGTRIRAEIPVGEGG
jgi:PAS domain S-box-containing protein